MSKEYGLSLAQRGTPVGKAADYEKVFDSRWRILEIEHEEDIDITFNPGAPDGYKLYTIYNHHLGFIPAFEFQLDTSVIDPAYTVSVQDIVAGNEQIYFNFIRVGTSAPLRIKGHLRVYMVDITKTYKATSGFTTPQSTTSGKDFGLKVLQQGQIANTMLDDDISHYTMHTAAKGMSIHMTGLASMGATTPYQATLTHGLGYLPTYMLYEYFQETSGVYTNPLAGQYAIRPVLARFTATAQTLSIGGVQAALTGSVAYLILKDPVRLKA